MAIALKESPFESEMAIAPPLVCGMTPLGTAVSSSRRPLWGMSTHTADGDRRLHIVQIAIEDMALVARARHVTEIPLEGAPGSDSVWQGVSGIGGNDKVIWATGWTGYREPPNTYRDGRLYDINPRDFTVRRSMPTPSARSNENRPLHVGGDDHTVWVYNQSPRPQARIYKLSATTLVVQATFNTIQTNSLSGDRHGFWVIRPDVNVRLVYYDADFVKHVDVSAPLWEYRPGGRRLWYVVGVGGKDAVTGRDHALICLTHREDEGDRLHLVDATDFTVLRSTLAQRGQYGFVRIGK